MARAALAAGHMDSGAYLDMDAEKQQQTKCEVLRAYTESSQLAVGTGRYCPPRRATRSEPSSALVS